MTLPQFIGVQSPASRADAGADKRALLAAGEATDGRASDRGPSDGQLIAMFFPETAVTAMTYGLR